MTDPISTEFYLKKCFTSDKVTKGAREYEAHRGREGGKSEYSSMGVQGRGCESVSQSFRNTSRGPHRTFP